MAHDAVPGLADVTTNSSTPTKCNRLSHQPEIARIPRQQPPRAPPVMSPEETPLDPAANEKTVVAGDEQERKKLRNRLSQRAFRRRQAERIRDLRNRVNEGQRPDDERIAALQRENGLLRAELVEVQTKLSRLLATFQVLSDSVAKTLEDTAADKHEMPEDESEPGNKKTSGALDDAPPATSMAMRPVPEVLPPSIPELAQRQSSPEFVLASGNLRSVPEDRDHGSLVTLSQINTLDAPFYQQIPNIWSFEYQTGMEPYLHAMNATEQSSLMLGRDWMRSNSAFSDHIQVLQRLLKDKFTSIGLDPSQTSPQSIYQPVLMVLSLFNSLTRPDVMAWYARTRFYHIIELTAWQLYPSTQTFDKLHARYRPTPLQLGSRYPPVVDWIPFPTIRDRLIQLHAANPRIDQIFCDAVSDYVVEANMSDLVAGAPPVRVYIRVTDLTKTMASATERDDGEELDRQPQQTATLPAPDTASLFASPQYARAAFRFLNMDQGASYYKIDPAFFGKYPELYDQASDIAAAGIPLKPDQQSVLTYPKPLDDSTVETYRSFIDFSLDASQSISTL